MVKSFQLIAFIQWKHLFLLRYSVLRRTFIPFTDYFLFMLKYLATVQVIILILMILHKCRYYVNILKVQHAGVLFSIFFATSIFLSSLFYHKSSNMEIISSDNDIEWYALTLSIDIDDSAHEIFISGLDLHNLVLFPLSILALFFLLRFPGTSIIVTSISPWI